MKIMMSAGEVSGDMHAAAVAKEIKRINPEAEIFGMGGIRMQKAGVRIIYDIENLGIIGFVEVIKHLPLFFKLLSFLKQKLKEEKPDVLVCVDYPGFNMKLAHAAKEMGIPVVYYIAPTIWAWNKSRAKNIVRDVKKVASIFPFEAKAYEKAGADVTFVGNPLADTVKPSLNYDEAMKFFNADRSKKRILLMPGSRKKEVSDLLFTMLSACRELSKKFECQFFLPRADTVSEKMLEEIFKKVPEVKVQVTTEKTYDLMNICTIAIASSGTATLETALMGLPTVLLYKLAPITWFFAKRLVQVKYAGLPNLLLKREITPELLQDEVTFQNIIKIVTPLLEDEEKRKKIVEDLKNVKTAMGDEGAVKRTAKLILKTAGNIDGKDE